ncbi:MAG TPA: ATP-grasp domain-containing protein [Trueperaceae bacterium]
MTGTGPPAGFEERGETMQRDERNSLCYWWERALDVDVPKPRTCIVRINRGALIGMLDGHPPPAEAESALFKAADSIGYPLFMRTDHASGKFEWSRTCFVERQEVLLRNIAWLVEWSMMADIFGLPIEAIVFREYLELDWSIKVYRGMPVAPERRYFVRDGRVVCHHPYWPLASLLQGGAPANEETYRLWQALCEETPEEVALLTHYAERLGAVLPGYWSVDFARGRDGTWYWIDAALGDDSFHPECHHRLASMAEAMAHYDEDERKALARILSDEEPEPDPLADLIEMEGTA